MEDTPEGFSYNPDPGIEMKDGPSGEIYLCKRIGTGIQTDAESNQVGVVVLEAYNVNNETVIVSLLPEDLTAITVAAAVVWAEGSTG